MSDYTEQRAGQLVECRGSTGNGVRKLGGLACVFGSRSQLLPGGFHEIVSPRAFDQSKADGWVGVSAKFEHRDVLGTVRGNTLALTLTAAGLDYTVDVVPSTIGDHAYALAQRGDLASSFAFIAQSDWFEMGSDGIPVRHLDSVLLRDVSCVTDPAYLDATCAMRSLARQMSAPYEDVREYAQNGRLAAFFTRTDRPTVRKRPTWAQREVALMAVKYPEFDQARPMTSRQKLVQILALEEPGSTLTKRSWQQAVTELEGMRYAPWEYGD
jgi:uncharacterized protein